MGTTAQKLTYLNETKSQLKNTINYSGASITDDTFRQYPRKLYTQYLDILKNPDTLFNGMPKIPEQIGTELSLNDTANTRMKLELNPSELSQETTTGANLQKFNVRESTTSGNNYKCDEKGQVTNDGTSTGTVTFGYNLLSTNPMTLSAGTYTMKVVGVIGPNAYFIRSSNISISLNENQEATFTLSEDTNQFNIAVSFTAGAHNSNFYITLASGNTATTERYTGGIPQPNPDYSSEVQVIKGNNSIKIENKNLFSETDFATSMSPNITVTENTYLGEDVLYINPLNSTKTTYNIKCKANTQYVLALDVASASGTGDAYLFLNYSDGTSSNIHLSSLTNTFATKTITATNDKTVTGISLSCYAVSSNKYYFKGLMLREILTSADYVVHQEQVLPLNLPNGMEYCKIGDYEDEFEHDGDKWYLNKYISKVILDGSETWTYYLHYLQTSISNAVNWSGSVTTQGKCNAYICRDRYFIINDTYKRDKSLGIGSGFLAIYDSNYTNTTDFKTWLSNNNVTVYYQLSTPTHDEITDTTLINQLNAIEQAVSYDEQTNISQTNAGLPFIISASAVRSLANIFD